MKPIEPPTRQEVRREVDQILSRAQLTERRFFPLVFRMLRNVGLINTFRGVGWAPPLCLLAGWFFSLLPNTDAGNWIPISILLPLALTGVNTLVCVIEKKQEVWELKETCRYNGKYLLALRMLFLGLLGLMAVGIAAAAGGSGMERFLLAAVSLFLCGNFLLAALRFLRESWFWAALAFWMLLGGFLAAYFQVLTPFWVPSIPLPLLALAAAGAGLLYLWQTKQLAFRPIGGFWKC